MFLLVPAYPGCPGSKAIKRSLLGLQLSKNDTLMVLRVLIQATFLLLFHSCYAVQNSTIVGLVEVFPAEIPSDST